MKLSNLRRFAASILTASVVLTSASIKACNASAQNSEDSKASYIEEWRKALGGVKLVHLDSYSSSGGGTGGYNAKETISLCSNGHYFYTSSKSVYLDVPGSQTADTGVPGTSATSAGSKKDTGQWKVVDAAGPNHTYNLGKSDRELIEQHGLRIAILELTPKDGTPKGQSRLVLKPNGEKYLNDRRVYEDSKDKVCS